MEVRNLTSEFTIQDDLNTSHSVRDFREDFAGGYFDHRDLLSGGYCVLDGAASMARNPLILLRKVSQRAICRKQKSVSVPPKVIIDLLDWHEWLAGFSKGGPYNRKAGDYIDDVLSQRDERMESCTEDT